MTKAKQPGTISLGQSKIASLNFEENSVTLEDLIESRKQKNQALLALIQSCRNDDDIKRIDELGLLTFETTSI